MIEVDPLKMNQIITKTFLFFTAFTILSCANENPNEKPNVLLIIADDLRTELNCYGADYIHSPNSCTLGFEIPKRFNSYIMK